MLSFIDSNCVTINTSQAVVTHHRDTDTADSPPHHKSYFTNVSCKTRWTSAELLTRTNPLTSTVVIWVQLQSILCQTGLSRHL